MGMDALLAYRWPGNLSLVSILVRLTTLADQLEARDCNGQRAVDYARDAGDDDTIRAIADATQWLSLR
jgi:transcriptional regulator of acetoin/glycerol metabolism